MITQLILLAAKLAGIPVACAVGFIFLAVFVYDLANIKAGIASIVAGAIINMIPGRALNITALAGIPMGGLVGGPFLHKMMAGVGLILTDLAGGITGLAKLVLLFILLQMTIGALVPMIFGI